MRDRRGTRVYCGVICDRAIIGKLAEWNPRDEEKIPSNRGPEPRYSTWHRAPFRCGREHLIGRGRHWLSRYQSRARNLALASADSLIHPGHCQSWLKSKAQLCAFWDVVSNPDPAIAIIAHCFQETWEVLFSIACSIRRKASLYSLDTSPAYAVKARSKS